MLQKLSRNLTLEGRRIRLAKQNKTKQKEAEEKWNHDWETEYNENIYY